ncbi:LysM peptidoglycan-binding domain-containing protein [Mycobacterium sp.]|uniref:LysM peptidoglycan-binding domain-containing protein n=1 Tax=Mycobacterium sp. TaxID=1785 RepID=UPI00333F2E80
MATCVGGHAGPSRSDRSRDLRRRAGDTLSGIAERFGVSLGAPEAANPQITNPDLILPGQVIRIP